MTRHKNFEDINGNVEIQDALRDLYDNPDLIELYPGLFCEGNGDWDAKTKTGRSLDPGKSCPNHTGTALWRGVFPDAVTLVRSDRFNIIVSWSLWYGVHDCRVHCLSTPWHSTSILANCDPFAIGLECCISHRMGYA